MDASCTIQDNIHLSKLNIYVSRILGTHHFYEIMIFESLPFFKNYLFNKLYNVLTCTPVAPFGRYFSAFDKYAVPAISR